MPKRKDRYLLYPNLLGLIALLLAMLLLSYWFSKVDQNKAEKREKVWTAECFKHNLDCTPDKISEALNLIYKLEGESGLKDWTEPRLNWDINVTGSAFKCKQKGAVPPAVYTVKLFLDGKEIDSITTETDWWIYYNERYFTSVRRGDFELHYIVWAPYNKCPRWTSKIDVYHP